MKNLVKIVLALMLSTALGCGGGGGGTTGTETPETGENGSGEVKFGMQIVAPQSSVLFNGTDDKTPTSVALQYRPVGGTEVAKSIELTIWKDGSYVTHSNLTLDAGDYEVTKFDILNDSGYTIYSTPREGSDMANSANITTALDYPFTVTNGATNTVEMQVVAVENASPADFGHTAFTFEIVGYNIFYLDVLAFDTTAATLEEAWQYTTAQLTVKNATNDIIKDTLLDTLMNKIIVSASTSYTLELAKSGFATQTFSFPEDSLKLYNSEPFVVEFK